MGFRRDGRRGSAFAKGTAAFMATVAMLQFHAASGAPGDIFTVPAPVIGADPPKATELKDGDASVSSQTGALSYSYEIEVPPGRNGQRPHLSLTYSSQAPVYGGLAAGWSLSIPEISEDTSGGRLRTHSPASENTPGAALDDKFVSSMAGGRPLVRTNETTLSTVVAEYRAQNDSTFARYFRMIPGHAARWMVLTTDGLGYLFGEASYTSTCGGLISDGYAPLTRTLDQFGNEVSYEYGLQNGECVLQKIRYGQNAAAGLGAHAEVQFQYTRGTVCSGVEVGSRVDYRTGTKIVSGANRMTAIAVHAYGPSGGTTPIHTRGIVLGYSELSESCVANHSAVRLLTSIQEQAVGNNAPLVGLPPVRFTYGDPAVELTNTISYPTNPWFDTPGLPTSNLSWGYRSGDSHWPTVEAMMLDVDGDGILDRLYNGTTTSNGVPTCRAYWQRGMPRSGAGATLNYAVPVPVAFGSGSQMPMLRWQTASAENAGQICALNGQATVFHNSHRNGNICHDNVTSCVPGEYCPDGNMCGGNDGNDPITYLAYRWLDMDGDGLTDLVGAVHGTTDVYDIIRGNDLVNGQPLGYEPPLFGTVPLPGGLPSCNGGAGSCKAIDSACMTGARTCDVTCSFNWPKINTCEFNASDQQCELHFGMMSGAAPDPSSTQTPAQRHTQRYPYKLCNNKYPWFIFKNLGNGKFSDTPTIKLQPIPLESDYGDSSLFGGVTSQTQGMVDIDGDGLSDAVVQARDANAAGHPWWWYVWLNDGTGGLGPTRYIWIAREHFVGAVSGTSGFSNSMGLFDINGDGLPDHWLGGSQPGANFAINNGTQFLVFPPAPYIWGDYNTAFKPGTEGYASGVVHEGSTVLLGDRFSILRPLDIDADGRPDIVEKPIGTTFPAVHFNQGGQFASNAFASDDLGRIQWIRADDTGSSGMQRLLWQLKSDVIDLNGDGLPESVWWTSAGMVQKTRDPSLAPPRLMTSITNGRGLTTTVAYASMHDVTAVEQHPELMATVNGVSRPKASPHVQWVVKSMTDSDSVAATSSTTSWFYKNPRHHADDTGKYSFRGFEEVTTTKPSGARTLQRYSYSPDWSGRLAETLVMPAASEGAGDVRSIERTTWESRLLFGGALTTYHATVTEHLTCANGQTETGPNACTATSAPGYTRTTSTLTALSAQAGQAASLWQETSSLLQSGTSAADGDRETTTTYVLKSNFTTYRLRPLVTTKSVRSGSTMNVFAKSAKTWDPNLNVALTDEVWFDSNDTNRAITRSVYNMTTGSLIERWKPKQNAASTTKTTYAYDPAQLFVTRETNELGDQLDYVYEYGTGAKLQTDGPNACSCTTGCPTDPLSPVKERHLVKLDALGRPLERWETTSDDGNIYTLVQLETTAYVDAATATVPTSVTNRTRLENTATSLWKQEKTELDGHGRPVKKTLLAQGSAPNDHITSFVYRNDGTLQSVSLPDPSRNDASTVTYTYGFDSLGRATSMRRPDASAAANQSGVNISYNGVEQTTTEVVGAAGGKVAVTRTQSDRFGRLSKVFEQTAASPVTWATTTYTYGPDDAVATVLDPENVLTTLVHDFAGHRTQISRAGRAWKYGYDRNGNMISEQVPGSTSPVTDVLYATTTAYDDLDRPLSKVIAPRSLSAADRALFASDTETFTWDYGPNHKGRLRYWRAFAPGATTPSMTVDLGNDAQGRRTVTNETLAIAGYPEKTRQVRQTNYLFGGVRTTSYNDLVGAGTATTSSSTAYDARLLPTQMTLQRTGEPALTLAVQTRNVAGLVTKRRTNTTGAMTFVESNWTYDPLGRVVDQTIQKGPGPTQVARQSLAYFGNDDPRSLNHYLGTSGKELTYTYDLRHQLTGAASTTAGYFDATYAYGNAGRFARATEAQTITPLPAGTEVKPRDVNYVYGGTDPEQVTALKNVSGGATYASYTYDSAGNQVTRTYPTTNESWTYTYDGLDQLRRATKRLNNVVQGSEEYWYDNNGIRIAIVKRDAVGAKTDLIWFIGDVEAHYDDAGVVSLVYSQLSLGTPVGRVGRTSNLATALEFEFRGISSSMIATLDTSGSVGMSARYSPFGRLLEIAGPESGSHHRRFSDKYIDSISALYYYGKRYYDSLQLAWTQADPRYRFAPDRAEKMVRRGLLYAFNMQNPIRYVDPDGMDSIKDDIVAPIVVNYSTGQISKGPPDKVGRIAGLAISIAASAHPVTSAIDKVASYDPDASVFDKLMSAGHSIGGAGVQAAPDGAMAEAFVVLRAYRKGKGWSESTRVDKNGNAVEGTGIETATGRDAAASARGARLNDVPRDSRCSGPGCGDINGGGKGQGKTRNPLDPELSLCDSCFFKQEGRWPTGEDRLK